MRFTGPVPLPDDDEGTLVRVTAKVTGIDDGIATVLIDARVPADSEDGRPVKVLGAARARVRLEEPA